MLGESPVLKYFEIIVLKIQQMGHATTNELETDAPGGTGDYTNGLATAGRSGDSTESMQVGKDVT